MRVAVELILEHNPNAVRIDVAHPILPSGAAAMVRGALIRHQLRDRAIGGDIKMWSEGGATSGKVGQRFERGPKVAMKHDEINAAAAPRRASGWRGSALLNVILGHGASFCYRRIKGTYLPRSPQPNFTSLSAAA